MEMGGADEQQIAIARRSNAASRINSQRMQLLNQQLHGGVQQNQNQLHQQQQQPSSQPPAPQVSSGASAQGASSSSNSANNNMQALDRELAH